MSSDVQQVREEMHSGFHRIEARLERMEDQLLTRVARVEEENADQWTAISESHSKTAYIKGVVAVAFLILAAALGVTFKLAVGG